MESKRIKLPVGISSYVDIRNEGYYYADKTEYIKTVEELDTKYPILLRPRRFGKSLFADTLKNYYDIKQKDHFDQLFGGTYIGQNKTPKANSYHVLHFNFSGLDTRSAEQLEKSFGSSVKTSIARFITYYGLKDIELEQNESFLIYVNRFLTALDGRIETKLYIIIDEYDHFANSMLDEKKALKKVTDKDGFIRSFYETLKTHTQFIIDRMFITGVTSITLDSLTSGFNIATNVSNFPSLNSAIGFTFAEVNELLDLINVQNKEETLELFKRYYNGYLFSERSSNRVYNSNMILYYLSTYLNMGARPKMLKDPNMTSDYNKFTSMLNLYTDSAQKEEVIQSLMSNEVLMGKLMTSFDLSVEFTYDHFISLLYYLGLLTIEMSEDDESSEYCFKAPNQVIREIYYDYYFEYLTNHVEITDIMMVDALDALENNHLDNIVSLVEKIIGDFTKNNKRYMIHFRENTLQALFYLILRRAKKYKVHMEYKISEGYIDILSMPVNKKYKPYCFELKYISEKKSTEDSAYLDRKISDVKQQADKDRTAIGTCKVVEIIFVGPKCAYKRIRVFD